MTVLLILAGFVALIAGGEVLVRGAVGAAARLGVSPLVIGLTLVGFGTSTPELLTSVQASLRDSPGIAVGNVVGSNIANVLLILGVAAVVMPVAVDRRAFWRDGVMLALATLAGVLLVLNGSVGRLAGASMIVGLVAYILVAIRTSGFAPALATDAPAAGRMSKFIVQFVVGLGLTILGAKLLVEGAILAARGLGVSEAVIGLTVVAIGTSLPELVTSVVAARRGQSDLALGNVIGSNVFNILGILGVAALVRPLGVPESIATFDVWVMAAAAVALVVAAATGLRVTRMEGAALLLAYFAYLAVLATLG